MTKRRPPDGDKKQLRSFAVEAARLMADRHCEDIRLLDVRGLSPVCDYVLIGSGTSDRQMKSVAAELEGFGLQRDNPMYRSDADTALTWIVIDFVDLVTHLFEPNQRAYYDLEGMWSDAEVVPWRQEESGNQATRRRGSASA
ncbi:MAG: ribosome silencing factor [Planctomycetota bacterium]|jgi:ribosome-associated protein